MSDVMLIGVLRMPTEMITGDQISLHQFIGRARQAAGRIESDGAEIDRLRAALERAQMSLAGCGVISGCNTEESFAKATSGIHPDYMTASLQSVIDAVRREIDLRAALSERDRMLGEAVESLKECVSALACCGKDYRAQATADAFLSAYDASKKESVAEIFPGTREALNRLTISGGKDE